MPLIRKDVQAVLRTLDSGKTNSRASEDSVIADVMERAGLTLEECVGHLSDIINGADSSSVKKAALDTALKLHGVLKDTVPPPPSVTILIQDPGSETVGQTNPILIPRQISSVPQKREEIQ